MCEDLYAHVKYNTEFYSQSLMHRDRDKKMHNMFLRDERELFTDEIHFIVRKLES